MKYWKLVMVMVLLAGCSKSHPSPFANLQRFVGKGSDELMKDSRIGADIKKIVPQNLYGCMEELFNYSRDITLLTDGSIMSEATGSHADSFRIGYVSVTPLGRIDVVLDCEADHKHYRWYSTAPIETNGTPDLIRWAKIVAGDVRDPWLQRFGEGYTRLFSYGDVNDGDLTSPAIVRKKQQRAEHEAIQAQRPGARFIKQGAVICSTPRSFYKVKAVEITGNSYASMPNDCEYVGSETEVNILQEFSDPVVGSIAVVGNSGGSAYVRMKDVE